MFKASQTCFKNRHGSFEIGEWVEFSVNRPDWKGDTAGDVRHNGEEFFIRTCNSGRLAIGPGAVDAESIRKPAPNKFDRLVKSLP